MRRPCSTTFFSSLKPSGRAAFRIKVLTTENFQNPCKRKFGDTKKKIPPSKSPVNGSKFWPRLKIPPAQIPPQRHRRQRHWRRWRRRWLQGPFARHYKQAAPAQTPPQRRRQQRHWRRRRLQGPFTRHHKQEVQAKRRFKEVRLRCCRRHRRQRHKKVVPAQRRRRSRRSGDTEEEERRAATKMQPG